MQAVIICLVGGGDVEIGQDARTIRDILDHYKRGTGYGYFPFRKITVGRPVHVDIEQKFDVIIRYVDMMLRLIDLGYSKAGKTAIGSAG